MSDATWPILVLTGIGLALYAMTLIVPSDEVFWDRTLGAVLVGSGSYAIFDEPRRKT